MRTLTATLVTSLALISFAYAQTPNSPKGTAEDPPQAQSNRSFKSVVIVDVEELPPAARATVDASTSRMTPEELDKLHRSIDAVPEISSALSAKGVRTSQVVAAMIDDEGALTLVTKRAG